MKSLDFSGGFYTMFRAYKRVFGDENFGAACKLDIRMSVYIWLGAMQINDVGENDKL